MNFLIKILPYLIPAFIAIAFVVGWELGIDKATPTIQNQSLEIIELKGQLVASIAFQMEQAKKHGGIVFYPVGKFQPVILEEDIIIQGNYVVEGTIP